MIGDPFSRRSFFRGAALLGAAAAAPIGLSACAGSSTGSGGSGQVTVWSVKDPQHSAQLVYAAETGLFEQEGLDVEVSYIVNGPDLPSLAASGEIGLMSATVDMVASLREQNVDFSWLMKLSEISNTQGVVLAADSGISSPAELAGRRMGMYKGAAVELAVLNMAEANGVDFGAIEFVNLEPPEQMSALLRGDIDAMACWEPFIGNAVGSGGTKYFTGNRSFITGVETPVDWLYLTTGLTASASFMEQSPDVITAVMRACLAATEAINADTPAAAAVIAGPLDIPEEQLLPILQANSYDSVIDRRFVAGWTDYLTWAAAPQQQFLRQNWNPLDLTDFTLFETLDPDAVQI